MRPETAGRPLLRGIATVFWAAAISKGAVVMEYREDGVHLGIDEARGGSTPHIVRYVLAFSLVLAILALSSVWILGAVSN